MKVFSAICLAGIASTVTAAPISEASPLFTNLLCPKQFRLPSNAISPSLLLPISKKQPKKAFSGTQHAVVTPNDMCTIFNLDLPDTLNGKPTVAQTCDLIFSFPNFYQAPLFSFSGPGHFDFTGYAIGVGAVEGVTTYKNQPAPGPSPPNPPKVMKPGNSYVINSAPCGIPPGSGRVTVSGSLCSTDTSFSFYQSDVICPLGFYVVIS